MNEDNKERLTSLQDEVKDVELQSLKGKKADISDPGYSSASSGSSFFADSPSVREEDSSHRDISSRLVEHMKHQLGEIRNVWGKKVDDLKRAIIALKASGRRGDHRNEKDREMFDIVLCIFNGPIEQASDAINLLEEAHLLYSDEAEFLIPQIAVYLLYGPQESAELLLCALLRICSKSSTFAHRLYYFISSFALSEAGVDPTGVFIIRRLLSDIAKEGEIPSRCLAFDESSNNKQDIIYTTTTDADASTANPSATQLASSSFPGSSCGSRGSKRTDIVPEINESMNSSVIAAAIATGTRPCTDSYKTSKFKSNDKNAGCKVANMEGFLVPLPTPVSSTFSTSPVPKTTTSLTHPLQQPHENFHFSLPESPIKYPLKSTNKKLLSSNEIGVENPPESVKGVEGHSDPLFVITANRSDEESDYKLSQEYSIDIDHSVEVTVGENFNRNINAASVKHHNFFSHPNPTPFVHHKTVNMFSKYHKDAVVEGLRDGDGSESRSESGDTLQRQKNKTKILDTRDKVQECDIKIVMQSNYCNQESMLREQYVSPDGFFTSSIQFWNKMIKISRVLGSTRR